MERPKCYNCQEPQGIIMLNDFFFCGKCYQDARNKMTIMMREALKE